MKLTKAKLIMLTKQKLNSFGYSYFDDTQTGSSGLFIKMVESRCFLSLGLVRSTVYDTMFTASYYLSKNTRWGSVWGDIPRESYRRISAFLTKEEWTRLVDKGFNGEGLIDAWWDSSQESGVRNFLEAVQLSESRFLKQESLCSKIDSSSEVTELESYSSKVIALVSKGVIDEQRKYNFVPDRAVDSVPLIWFKASETVIEGQKGILNKKTVSTLAIDSARQSELMANSALDA